MAEKQSQQELVRGLTETLSELNKKSGEGEVYIFEDNITPTDVTGWVSTGSDLLDIIISNRKYGGFPLGKIIELQGNEASGKSLIGSHAIANVQKMGGIGIYIDTESAVNREFLQVLGVNLEQLVYVSTDTIESVFEIVENIVTKIRNDDKEIPVVILIDSISAAKSRAESESDYGTDGYATHKARIMSKAMRKLTVLLGKQKICVICTSQLRTNLGASFGDKFTTSGGKALGFHASVRIRLTSSGKIKLSGSDKVVGSNIKAKVIKNRMGPPFKVVEFPLYFTSGINNTQSYLELIKDLGLISGRSILYDDEKVSFTKATFSDVVDETPGLKDYIYDKVCDSLISTYIKPDKINLDEVEITDEQLEQD